MNKKFSRFISLLAVGAISPSLLLSFPTISRAQVAQNTPGTCGQIVSPLTPEEQVYAREAWQYFVNNYNPETGFVNSVNNYPSGTLWDMGNYLMALNTARQLGLIDQGEFDARLNKFLTSLSQIPLFEGSLPNKVYNAATGEMVDYGNNVLERGIGWSALDIGRILAAFHVIRTCYPQYKDWLEGIIASWDVARSVQDEQLYGATVLPNGETLLVQEGRLGYEEYAARGYELWGYSVPKAIALEPYKIVEVNGVELPIDERDFQSTNANNYVVSESYILDAIEFGLGGSLDKYARRVLEAQKQRYEQTGELTAVTEDNINQAPYFLYNTVYANGTPWATITEQNKQFPELRTLSTKAALGWHYLYPNDPYAQQLYNVAKDLRSPDGGGFWAGLYSQTNQPNDILTGNTNGLILEMLYFKARGRQPLIGGDNVSFATDDPEGTAYIPPENPPAPALVPEPVPAPGYTRIPDAVPLQSRPPVSDVEIPPIAAVGNWTPSVCPKLSRPLSIPERRFAAAAWQYFNVNYNSKTGLVRDRAEMTATSLWGMGDYLAALHAARSLDIITPSEFDLRVRKLLGALQRLPLFAGQLPHRGYDTQTLQPIDYGGNLTLEGGANPTAEGTGWSAYDMGRMLAALYTLKSCHPQYTQVVDETVLEWNFLPVVRDGLLLSGRVIRDERGRLRTVANAQPRLGYEEYAARAFQLWGFDVTESAVGGNYTTTEIEGIQVPTGRARERTTAPSYLVTDPFALYGLEFGLDPQMQALVQPMLQAQERRYQRTGTLTASSTTQMFTDPYIVHSSIIGNGKPWATLNEQGELVPSERTVGTAVSFALYALFPNNEYSRKLWEGTTDLYTPRLGYYEGYSERTGRRTGGFTASTNSMVLQSLLHLVTNSEPLIRREASLQSPWWEAVKEGNPGQGLPREVTPQVRLETEGGVTYWTSENYAEPLSLETEGN